MPAHTRAALPILLLLLRARSRPSLIFTGQLHEGIRNNHALVLFQWCIFSLLLIQVANNFLYYMDFTIEYFNFSQLFGYSYLSLYLNTLFLQCSIILFQAFKFSFKDTYKVKKIFQIYIIITCRISFFYIYYKCEFPWSIIFFLHYFNNS